MKSYRLKLPLKIKLTLISSTILTVMCICLTVSAIHAGNTLTDTMGMFPAQTFPSETPLSTQSPEHVITPSIALTQATKDFRTGRIMLMISLIFLGSALTYFFADKTLKPLENLTNAANDININTLENNLPLPGTGDEVERLTQSFNHMTSKLHASYQMQKNFSANAAHELRTPLAALQTQIDVFQMKSERTPEEYTSLIEHICESTDRLSRLVSDLLSFTNEQSILPSRQVDLRSLIDEVIFELEETAAEKNILLTVSGAGIVDGDDTLLQRVFFNLISNAIRYNVEHGSVSVEISSHTVTVADTGIGIPDAAKPHVFNTFYCVDKSRSRELGGSGLGLAIAQDIIEKHGGQIDISDNTPSGSMFTVRFPEKSS